MGLYRGLAVGSGSWRWCWAAWCCWRGPGGPAWPALCGVIQLPSATDCAGRTDRNGTGAPRWADPEGRDHSSATGWRAGLASRRRVWDGMGLLPVPDPR